MTGLVIAASVAAVAGLLVAGLCRAASRGDRDDQPPAKRQPADAGALFHIQPEETDQP